MGQKSQRVVDRSSGHLHVKGTMRVQDLKCEWSVRMRSSKAGTTTIAHETWRAKCEDDYFVRHKCYLEPHEKNSRVRKCHMCVRFMWCSHTPSLTRQSPLPVSETPCKYDFF